MFCARRPSRRSTPPGSGSTSWLPARAWAWAASWSTLNRSPRSGCSSRRAMGGSSAAGSCRPPKGPGRRLIRRRPIPGPASRRRGGENAPSPSRGLPLDRPLRGPLVAPLAWPLPSTWTSGLVAAHQRRVGGAGVSASRRQSLRLLRLLRQRHPPVRPGGAGGRAEQGRVNGEAGARRVAPPIVLAQIAAHFIQPNPMTRFPQETRTRSSRLSLAAAALYCPPPARTPVAPFTQGMRP